MIFFYLLVFIVCFIYLYLKCGILIKNFFIMSKIPGPPSKGYIIGNMYHLQQPSEKLFQVLRKCARDFYPVYKLYTVFNVGINILSPEDCELILSNPVHNEKGYIYKLLHQWLRFGLLTSRGTRWQKRRKILTPAFHFNILQQFICIFNEEAEKLVAGLKSDHRQVNVTPHINQFTLKTITETAMGTKLELKNKKERNYKQAVYEIGRILRYRLTHPLFIDYRLNFFSPLFRKERQVVKTLHNFTKEVIEDREKNFDDTELPKEEHDVYKGKKRLAMLDLLLSTKRREGTIFNDGIQEEVDTFMFEGHDTTAVALGFVLLLLANNKDAQKRIVEEMLEVLEDGKPTYHDLQKLQYMERCIKESLRLYPSVFFMSRTLGEDVKLNSGYEVPKGTTVVVHIYDIHHNHDIYPDPEKFDPDRFLPENCQKRHPYAYLPFSAGPRNCIGQKFAMLEMKATLCAILGSFVLEPVDTVESVVLVADIVLRAKDGIRVRFVPRELGQNE